VPYIKEIGRPEEERESGASEIPGVISSPAGKLGLGSVYNTIQHYKYIHYFLM
jgi:hypothetical protein